MGKMDSISAVKDAIGGGEKYYGRADAYVLCGNKEYIYRDIEFSVRYDYGYMQMRIEICWEDDEADKPPYHSIGLHGQYNTNFQEFAYSCDRLKWSDGNNRIEVNIKADIDE